MNISSQGIFVGTWAFQRRKEAGDRPRPSWNPEVGKVGRVPDSLQVPERDPWGHDLGGPLHPACTFSWIPKGSRGRLPASPTLLAIRCPTPAARPAPGHSWPFPLQLGDWPHAWESGFMERAVFGPLGLGKELGLQNLIWVGVQLSHPLAG